MPLELSSFKVMEHLWESMEKTKDGKHIAYTMLDIEQLWQMGFVDTKKFGMEEWKAVFEPYKQPDGTFLLNHEQFLVLDDYRYKGEIRVPFDAMRINEGKYTDEGLDQLINASITPSCSLESPKLREFFEALKKDFRQDDGLILIKRPAKERIKAMLETHPSPLRNLEILLDRMLEVQGEALARQLEGTETEAATLEAAKQVSSFTTAPTSRAEAKAKGLKKIEKARPKRAAQPKAKGKPEVEVKKIRRSRKGMRG
jgi:hypothetical protein